MNRRWWALVIVLGLASDVAQICATSSVASAEESTVRVDTFDQQSRRQGYITIDPRSGRLDQFDRHSNRTGYGVIAPSGRVDTFSNNGQRGATNATITNPGGTRK